MNLKPIFKEGNVALQSFNLSYDDYYNYVQMARTIIKNVQIEGKNINGTV